MKATTEKACKDDRIIKTARANTLDKFELGIGKMMQDFMRRHF
jgi:hypothetical protein